MSSQSSFHPSSPTSPAHSRNAPLNNPHHPKSPADFSRGMPPFGGVSSSGGGGYSSYNSAATVAAALSAANNNPYAHKPEKMFRGRLVM